MSSWKYIAAQRNPKHRGRNITTLLFFNFNSENCFCPRLSHARARTSVKKELNLATVLVCIVFVFLFCNIPRVFVNCYEFLSSEEVIRWADIWFEVFFLCNQTGFRILVEYYTWWNMSVRAFYLKAKLIDPDVTPPSTFSKKVIGWKSVNKPQPFSDYALLLCKSNLCYIFFHKNTSG